MLQAKLNADWNYAKTHGRLLELDEHAIVYGAGKGGREFLAHWKPRGVRVRFFCDEDASKHGQTIDGIEIRPASQIKAFPNDPVVIACRDWRAASTALAKLGVQRFYCADDADNHIRGPFCGPVMGHFDAEILQAGWNDVEWLYGKMADDTARVALEALVRYRLTRKACDLIPADFPQYFHPQVHPEPADTVLDVGAWIGDTLEAFVHAVGPKGHVVCFEPTPNSFAKLEAARQQLAASTRVTTINAAVGRENGSCTFLCDTGNTAASRVADGPAANLAAGPKSINVPLVTLDSVCERENLRPSFIKMDIEGAELDAIAGAKNIIRTCRPKLAICVYHKPDDLWAIPRAIDAIRDDYTYYLAHHSITFCETVLYAKPRT